jgi:hypothetical protein
MSEREVGEYIKEYEQEQAKLEAEKQQKERAAAKQK